MTVTRRSLWFALTLALLHAAGCGGQTHPAAMNAVELLDILEDDLKKHDPQEYTETHIGKFNVTHVVRESKAKVSVRFELYAVLPAKKEEEFLACLEGYEKRIRDSVISLVQQAETEQLTDPGLTSLKEEVVGTINRVTKKRLVKDVVFSEFLFERI